MHGLPRPRVYSNSFQPDPAPRRVLGKIRGFSAFPRDRMYSDAGVLLTFFDDGRRDGGSSYGHLPQSVASRNVVPPRVVGKVVCRILDLRLYGCSAKRPFGAGSEACLTLGQGPFAFCSFDRWLFIQGRLGLWLPGR